MGFVSNHIYNKTRQNSGLKAKSLTFSRLQFGTQWSKGLFGFFPANPKKKPGEQAFEPPQKKSETFPYDLEVRGCNPAFNW